MEKDEGPGGQNDIDEETDNEDRAHGLPGSGQHDQERQDVDLQVVAVAASLAKLVPEQEEHEVEKGGKIDFGETTRDLQHGQGEEPHRGQVE